MNAFAYVEKGWRRTRAMSCVFYGGPTGATAVSKKN